MQRVLAVDDNARNLLIIQKCLAGEFELMTASSGEEALEIAPRFRPDLILLDIMMTGIDGYETCRRLRTTPGAAHCKIIMVSARGACSDRLAGYAAGADDYVTKPFEPDELVAKLKVYLRLKSVEEVDRLKSDLLGLLSHETRTPLSGILGPSALLLEEPGLTEEQREFVEMIRSSGQRLLALIEKVMYLSELKSGLVPLEIKTLDAAGLVNRSLVAARREAGREDVAVELDVQRGLQFECDSQHVEFAVEAMVHNALRLSPTAGVVRIAVREAADGCLVSISDQGVGIAPEFIERVFDEFVVNNILHHAEGHGLSLATARLIAEQHGGSLTVQSQPGNGAEFRFTLPSRGAKALAA
jgi:two-component system, sensor histidine kinase and response regulator